MRTIVILLTSVAGMYGALWGSNHHIGWLVVVSLTCLVILLALVATGNTGRRR
jgi:hypothetical protein